MSNLHSRGKTSKIGTNKDKREKGEMGNAQKI